jgi:hypothetical protein
MACGSQGAVDDAVRGMVAPHRVYGNVNHEMSFEASANAGRFWLAFVHRPNLASAVVPAVGTGAMRRLRLATVGTIARLGGHQGIVGPALGRSRFGVPPFGIGHDVILC